MQSPTHDGLDLMSVQELTELQDQIHLAIRARIREKNARLAGRPVVVPDMPRPVIDLERERDAWLAAKRKGG